MSRSHVLVPNYGIERADRKPDTSLHYVQVDVRDVPLLHTVVRGISESQGRLDGLIAAAGIQQETSALNYTAEDANTMFEVNITGVFMTAQAVAKELIRHGRGGSIAMIASMSGTVANRVSCPASPASLFPPLMPRTRVSFVLRTMPAKPE